MHFFWEMSPYIPYEKFYHVFVKENLLHICYGEFLILIFLMGITPIHFLWEMNSCICYEKFSRLILMRNLKLFLMVNLPMHFLW